MEASKLQSRRKLGNSAGEMTKDLLFVLTKCIAFILVVTLQARIVLASPGSEMDDGSNNLPNSQRHRIEGRVMVPQAPDQEWIASTRVMVDGGQYLGILRTDGSFAVTNIPSGSYVVEIIHPTFVFEPARVEINSKGKIRARALNNIQPSAVHALNYPLKFKARGAALYFQQREQWRITDFLYSPMVLMMFLPLVMMFVLPKLMNTQDPETQREMANSMNMLTPKNSLPDMSELLTNWFGTKSTGQSGGSGAKKAIKNKATKKTQ